MSTTALDNIVREVPLKEAVTISNNQREVWFDQNRGQATDTKPSFVGLALGGYAKFLVTTNRWVEHVGRPLQISGGRNRESLQVKSICRIQCPADAVLTLVESTAKAASPDAAIDAEIEDTFNERAHYLRGKGVDPVDDFFRNREMWQREVSRIVAERFGIRCQLELFADGEDSLGPLQLDLQPFSVSVNDAEDELSVELKIGLEVIPQRESQAILQMAKQDSLQQEIIDAVRRWVPQHCNLHRFCVESADIREELREVVNQVVAGYGRHVGRFVYRGVGVPLPQFDVVTCEHDIKIRKPDRAVKVRHKVMLELTDIATFRRSRIDDIDEWIAGELRLITQRVLIGREFVEVVTQFEDEIEGRIRQEINACVSQHGLSVQYFSSVASIGNWQDRIVFRLEREFSSKDDGVPASLAIRVAGKVVDLNRLKKHINDHADVPELMRAAVERQAAEFMDHQEADAVLQFTVPRLKQDTGKSHDEPSLEKALSENLVNYLRDEFGADCQVTVNQLKTPLLERLSALSGPDVAVELQVTSLEHVQVKYATSFHVDTPHAAGWRNYLAFTQDDVTKDLDRIGAFVKMTAEQYLHAQLPLEVLKYGAEENRRQIKGVVLDKEVVDAVRERFGLTIKFDQFSILDDPDVKAAIALHDQRRDRAIAHYNSKVAQFEKILESLYEQEQRAIASEDWESSAMIREKIDSYTGQLEEAAMRRGVIEGSQESQTLLSTAPSAFSTLLQPQPRLEAKANQHARIEASQPAKRQVDGSPSSDERPAGAQPRRLPAAEVEPEISADADAANDEFDFSSDIEDELDLNAPVEFGGESL